MDSSTGTSRFAASANASSDHGHQSTGLVACCSRYGLVEVASRFAMRPSLRLTPSRAAPREWHSVPEHCYSLPGRLAAILVEGLRDPAQVLVHRAHQQRHGEEEQQQDHQTNRRGLAEVLALPTGIRRRRGRLDQREPGHGGEARGQQQGHASTRSRTPANRSSSGTVVSTSERASSYSSVGHSSRCRVCGTANHRLVGSIWVACARNASSRTPKYSPHSTRVVTRSMTSGREGSHFASHSVNGDSAPAASSASCSSCIRLREK